VATTLRGIVATRIILTIAAVIALGSTSQAATLKTPYVVAFKWPGSRLYCEQPEHEAGYRDRHVF
jgi:hypothetical protein